MVKKGKKNSYLDSLIKHNINLRQYKILQFTDNAYKHRVGREVGTGTFHREDAVGMWPSKDSLHYHEHNVEYDFSVLFDLKRNRSFPGAIPTLKKKKRANNPIFTKPEKRTFIH